MQIAGRAIRASWSQILLYASAVLIAVEPWTVANLAPGIQKYVELAKIVLGVLVASGARSFIGRVEWNQIERREKTAITGNGTPPTK